MADNAFRFVDLARLVNLDRQLSGRGLDLSGADNAARKAVRRVIDTVAPVFPGKHAVPYGPGGERVAGEIRWFWADGKALFAQNADRLAIPDGYSPCPDDRGPTDRRLRPKVRKALKESQAKAGAVVRKAQRAALAKMKAGK